MFEIFESRFEPSNRVINLGQIELFKRSYRGEVDKSLEYFSGSSFFVKNNHLLVRILNFFNVDPFLGTEDFVTQIYARAPFIANQFRLTSERQTGQLFNDVFYRGTNIILYREDYFSIQEAKDNWRTLRPVQVLKHPVTSLSMLPPDPDRYPTHEEGLSVVTIDIALLLFQYRMFLREQQAQSTNGNILGAHHFVYRYVFPNMMASQTDLAVFNRFRAMYYGESRVNSERSKLPYPVKDYQSRVDLVLAQMVDYVMNSSSLYETYLKIMPAIVAEDAQEALLVPDYTRTRQIWGFLYLSRLDEIRFLLSLGGTVGEKRNQHHLARAKITAKRLLNENFYSRYFSGEELKRINQALNTILHY